MHSRLILFLFAVTLLVGCATVPDTPPPVSVTPASAASSGGVAKAAPRATAAPTNAPLRAQPAPTPEPPRDAIDLDRQAAQELRVTPLVRATPYATTAPAPPANKPTHPFENAELYIHLPPHPNQQPLRVFLALHGMGNQGNVFSQNLIKMADANNWVLVAPTFPYRDYFDPQQLMEDDIQLSKRLLDTLDVLPQRLNLKLYRQVLIYGYSRGAQLGHRFAYFYPERVKSVAVLSAGAYTMPTEKIASAKGTQIVPFPYGVGDLQECVGRSVNWQALRRVSFWVGVGERDNQPSDVARAFDAYGGRTRVERAQSFKQALQNLGIEVYLVIFPHVTHETTNDMRASALQFLRAEELDDPLDD